MFTPTLRCECTQPGLINTIWEWSIGCECKGSSVPPLQHDGVVLIMVASAWSIVARGCSDILHYNQPNNSPRLLRHSPLRLAPQSPLKMEGWQTKRSYRNELGQQTFSNWAFLIKSEACKSRSIQSCDKKRAQYKICKKAMMMLTHHRKWSSS